MRKDPSTYTSIDERIYPTLVRQSFIGQQPRLFKEFVCAAFPTMFFHNIFRFGEGFTFPDWVMRNFGSKHYFDASVLCLSTKYLAYLTKNPRLHQLSQHIYSQALGEIRKALSSDEVSSDYLLVTVILLSFHEMDTRTTRDAWLYHSRAVKQLMLKRGMDSHLSGAGRVCHFAYRPFIIAAAFCEGESCFLDEDDWQKLASDLRTEDSQKHGEWSFYVSVYETIFMELVKCPGYVKEARKIGTVTSINTGLLAQQIRITCDRLRILSNELRSMLASYNQRKDGIIFERFVGPEPNAFPETSPSLLLGAAVSAISILEQLFTRLTTLARSQETPSTSSTPQSVNTPDGGGQLLDFHFACELGGGTKKDISRSFTWLDRVAGSMGMLGAEINYGNAVEVE
jgi:hypothetical protein